MHKLIIKDYNNFIIKENLTIKEIIDIIKQNPNKKYFKIINNQEIEINNRLVCNTTFICHRINNLEELKKIDHNFGVELDIRDDHKTGKLILAHDPFVDGEDFENYLQNYSHNTLILNIKSERVELGCLKLLEKYNINNYFFLDSSFPMINLLNKKFNNNNIASRYSEYECLEFTENIKDLITWLWIDCFTILPFNKEIYERIKLLNKKICIVSPELQGQPEKIEIYRKQLFDNDIIPDAICCKEYNIYVWI
jgi:hypothetical protein